MNTSENTPTFQPGDRVRFKPEYDDPQWAPYAAWANVYEVVGTVWATGTVCGAPKGTELTLFRDRSYGLPLASVAEHIPNAVPFLEGHPGMNLMVNPASNLQLESVPKTKGTGSFFNGAKPRFYQEDPRLDVWRGWEARRQGK